MALLSLVPTCCSSESQSSIGQVDPYHLRWAGKTQSAATQNLMASHERLTQNDRPWQQRERVAASQGTQYGPPFRTKRSRPPTSLNMNGYLVIMVIHLSKMNRGATSEDHRGWLVGSFSRANSIRFRHRSVRLCRSRSGMRYCHGDNF